MFWIYVIGEILSPVDASRFSISDVFDVVHVAFEIVLGRNSNYCGHVFVPFLEVRLMPQWKKVYQKDNICTVLKDLGLGEPDPSRTGPGFTAR